MELAVGSALHAVNHVPMERTGTDRVRTKRTLHSMVVILASIATQGCGDGVVLTNDAESASAIDTALSDAIRSASNGQGDQWLILPQSDDYDAIPQDASNPITKDKIALGKLLFHDTAIATNARSGQNQTWSCATCHHAAAGFKSGVPQGIGEGGVGFGVNGSQRRLASEFDANADEAAPNKPDLQPVASPTVLNTAYQDVMLWNGQFGNSVGSINAGIEEHILATAETPKKENTRALSGLETQAIAGMDVHRLEISEATMQTYDALFHAIESAPEIDEKLVAGKAIAAFERTVLANRAPFQLWLRGDLVAMNDAEKRGGVLFFGKAGCADCHRGPALSSEVGANEQDVFMAVGFADFDPENQPLVHGRIAQADKLGRGGFTTDASDNYKFKIAQLYNLADTNVFGHGASFTSIRAVVEYKNAALAQNEWSVVNLDARFKPLHLSSTELDDLTQFLTTGLYDAELDRYQPASVPSGECIVVDPLQIETHGMCPE